MMRSTDQFCQVPKVIQFEFHHEQQLHTTITIVNKIDKFVNFKIKSNRSQLYLVKPMQGSIYKNDNTRITFKRKQLLKSDFLAYLNNPNVLPTQKFLVELKYQQTDHIGRQTIVTQEAYIAVRFRSPMAGSQISTVAQSKITTGSSTFSDNKPNISDQIRTSRIKAEESLSKLKEDINSKRNQLVKLKNKAASSTPIVYQSEYDPINFKDTIILLVIALLVGLAI